MFAGIGDNLGTVHAINPASPADGDADASPANWRSGRYARSAGYAHHARSIDAGANPCGDNSAGARRNAGGRRINDANGHAGSSAAYRNPANGHAGACSDSAHGGTCPARAAHRPPRRTIRAGL